MGVKQFSIYHMPEMLNKVDQAVDNINIAVEGVNLAVQDVELAVAPLSTDIAAVQHSIDTLNVSPIKSIQRGTATPSLGNYYVRPVTVNISSVNKDKSVCYCEFVQNDSVNGGIRGLNLDRSNTFCLCKLRNSTTIDVMGTGVTYDDTSPTVNWVVIEFN